MSDLDNPLEAQRLAFQFLLKDYKHNKKPCKKEDGKTVYVLSEKELHSIIKETAFACALSPTFFNELIYQSEEQVEE